MLKTILFFIFVLVCLGNHFAIGLANTRWVNLNMVTHTSNYTNQTIAFSSYNCHIKQGEKLLYRHKETTFKKTDVGNDMRQFRYEISYMDIKKLKYLEQDRVEWKFIPYLPKDANNSVLNSYHIYGSRPTKVNNNPKTNQPLCASENAIGILSKTREVYSLADNLNEAFDDRRCVWIIEEVKKNQYVFWNHAFNIPMFIDGGDISADVEFPRKTSPTTNSKYIFTVDCDHAKCNPHGFNKPLELD
jgi:hypothetical protein